MSAHGLAMLCRAGEDAAWLDDLPADPALRFERITTLLDNISRKRMDASVQLSCINALLPLVTDLVAEKINQQIPMALPLPAANIQNVRAAETAYLSMARAYEHVLGLTATVAAAGSMDLSPQEHATAHYGAMRCLAEALCLNFATYRKPGEGSWLRIHAVYASALQNKVQLMEVLDNPFDDATETVTQEYKRVLLLGLSDPYELPFAALGQLFHMLRDWSALAHLHSNHHGVYHNETFLVDPETDAPALPVLQHRAPPTRGWLLDTRELNTSIEREAHRLAADIAKDHSPNIRVFKTLQTIKILQRHWRGFVARHYPRKQSPQEYQMLIGLRAVVAGLRRSKDTIEDTETNENIVVTTHVLHGSFGAQQWLSEQRFAAPHQVRSVDENSEGMQLLIAPEPDLALHIGEFLAVKRSGNWEDWRVGVLRWAKTNENGKLAVGVYLIGYQATACGVQIADAALSDPQKEKDRLAVLVQLSHPPGIGQTLIAAPGIYSQHDKLWLRTTARPEIKTIGRLLLTTRSFDWFDIDN